jgi:hypothetical protein
VLRLLARLGFRGLPDFQQALRRELDDRQASPLVLYDARADAPEGPVVLAEAVRRTLDGLPSADLDRAVALLADRFSRLLAAYLQVRAQGGAVVLVTTLAVADRGNRRRRAVLRGRRALGVRQPGARDGRGRDGRGRVLAAGGDEARARMAACEQVARAADLLD